MSITQTDTERVAHIQALCDMNLALLAKNQALYAIIERLASYPADDFYKPGDFMSGEVVAAWIEARAHRAV